MEERELAESQRFIYYAPAERRDATVHRMFNDREAMMPQVRQLYGISMRDHTRRRETQREEMKVKSSFFLDVVAKNAKDHSEIVAVAGFRELRSGVAEWGIIVQPQWRGKGVAGEIFMANIETARSILGCDTIAATTTEDNSIMTKFLKRRGFKSVSVNGEWIRYEFNLEKEKKKSRAKTKELSSADSEMVAFMLKSTLIALILFICICPVDTTKVADLIRRIATDRKTLGAAGIGDALSGLRMEDVVGTETQGRLSRARVPLWFDVLKQDEVQKDGVQAKLLSYPDSHGLSLQSRADNKVFLKVLSGEFRLERLLTEGEEDYDDGEGEGEDESLDDCVCRGGRCPRRWGCKFWVETMSKRIGVRVFASQRSSSLLSPSDDCVCLTGTDDGAAQPFSLTATKSGASVLEVVLGDSPCTYYQSLYEEGALRRLQLMSEPPPGSSSGTYMGVLE